MTPPNTIEGGEQGSSPSREPESATPGVIFLDIDGPMIPATMYLIDKMCSWQRRFPETTVAVINELCARTGAKIVLNTTHNRPFDNVADILPAMCKAGVLHEHFHPTDPHTQYPDVPRDLSVKVWLLAHPEVTEWVALDDVKFTDDERLIWIGPDAGLHVGHLNAAIQKLGGKPFLVLM